MDCNKVGEQHPPITRIESIAIHVVYAMRYHMYGSAVHYTLCTFSPRRNMHQATPTLGPETHHSSA